MRVAQIVRPHTPWVVLAVLLAGGWMALAGRGSALASRTVASTRDVTCVYLAQVNHLPQDAHSVHVWIPLAETSREQRILRRDVHASVPYTIAQDSDYGNDILHVTLEPPTPEHLEVAIEYHAQLFGADAARADPPPTPRELQHNLQPSGLVIIDDEVRARAVRATARRTTPMDKARGIYKAVIQQVRYDKSVPGWGRGDTRRVCLLGTGNCTDFHSLFISMARAQQIPARFKIGVVIPQEASGTIPGYHCWAEFYEKAHGWVPVDASEAWKHPEMADYYFGTHDPSRLLLSVGRDLQLVPRQQGEPVNIFFAPYVEVDGQAFSDVSAEVRFTPFQQVGTGFTDLEQGRTT